jgi:hypothetical protein
VGEWLEGRRRDGRETRSVWPTLLRHSSRSQHSHSRAAKQPCRTTRNPRQVSLSLTRSPPPLCVRAETDSPVPTSSSSSTSRYTTPAQTRHGPSTAQLTTPYRNRPLFSRRPRSTPASPTRTSRGTACVPLALLLLGHAACAKDSPAPRVHSQLTRPCPSLFRTSASLCTISPVSFRSARYHSLPFAFHSPRHTSLCSRALDVARHRLNTAVPGLRRECPFGVV